MVTHALAILIAAISLFAASWGLGERAVDLPSYTVALGSLLISLVLNVLLSVGLWRVFRAARSYRSGHSAAKLGEELFLAQALVLALVMGGVIGAWLEREVAGRTLSTPLEGLAVPAGVLGALTVGGALFLLLRRIPRKLLALRLKGVVSATAVGDTIALTTGIGLIGAGLGLFVELTGNLSDLARSIVIATAGTLGYALPRLWLMRRAPHADPCLWLVLAHPNTVLNWPQLVDRIARSHRVGPLTLVSPPNAVPFGEHLYLADRLGMLDSLFPRLEIEVRDWQRTLPPADRWSGVVHRQVHPPVALMPMLLDSYLGPLDKVLLIASREDDVQIWRGRLPVDRTRVLWVPTQGEEQLGARPDRVAGYPVIVMDPKTRGRINMQGWFSSGDKQSTTNEEREAEAHGMLSRERSGGDERALPMSTIFISYRRADASGHADRLFDRLRQWFDPEAVFYDLDGIDIGDIFPARIQSGVESAAVVLVLIGPDWLAEINRRADQPGVDFVRREVELALVRHTQGALVLPVLIGGAAMPSPQQFHAELAGLSSLCALDAHELKGKQADWDAQFVRLRERIARVPGVPAPRFRMPRGSEPPFHVIEHSLSMHFQDPNGLLARLRAQLTASGSAAVLGRAALYGMGGVGKTQLALKYSLEYRDLYAGVWWFRAESETTLQLDAHATCEAAYVHIAQGETPATAFKKWLERQPTSWLLVYDNAETVAALRPYLPENKQHHLLITSRNPAWGGLAQPIELEVWTPEQGADFLAARRPGSVRAEVLALAHDLDGLPLALEKAASYLDETGTSVADYRTLLARIDTRDLILKKGRVATGYGESPAPK